ncbi:hypothetical protein D3C78_1518640 [compost metagenome]
MPKINCKCGNHIRINEILNPNEWLIISDREYDGFVGKIDAEELYSKMKSILICKKCGRLWVFWEGFQSKPVSYFPEENNYNQ